MICSSVKLSEPSISGTKPTSMPLRITCASREAVPSESHVASRPSGSRIITPNWCTPTRARSALVPRSRRRSTTRRALSSSMLVEPTDPASTDSRPRTTDTRVHSMANKTIGISDELAAYVVEVGTREPDLLARLREETAALPQHGMQIAPEQGAFLALLVELLGARRCIEVGTFTGYSSTAVALALPEDALLVCCDVSEEWTSMAARYWDEAGVADKIDLRIAPAAETLDGLLADGEQATYDFAFVDADKSGYDGYYERLLRLVRP